VIEKRGFLWEINVIAEKGQVVNMKIKEELGNLEFRGKTNRQLNKK
jgi:hypothetical protein